MVLDMDRALEKMRQMTVRQLLEEHHAVFGEPSASRHKRHLVRQLAWGLQARAAGGLSRRALRRAAELVENRPLHVAAATRREGSNGPRAARRRLPIPGTVLSRLYKGRTLHVEVLDDGLQYEGQVFKTLSAVAKAITGSHWSGYRFFGLSNGRKAKS